jgi:hypothetical protein
LQASAAELFTTHIPKGSTWRYYDSDPSLQASDWNAVVFNDEGWSNGAAPLGYESTKSTHPP